MRFCRIVTGVCLLAPYLISAPAMAGMVGDGCQPSVAAALRTYFAAEEKVTAAQASGGAVFCALLDEQTAALDTVVRTIWTCREGDENREFLPDIETLLRASVAQSIAQGCPQPAGLK